MQTSLFNKYLVSFISTITLLLAFNASAQNTKDILVDDIIQQSTIKIAVQGIPQQLAQIPQMLPVDPENQSAFVEDFMIEISNNFNEAEALNSIRQYFIDNGDEQKLEQIKTWLTSPMGRRITQAELLAQQQVDFVAMQTFMQSYKPEGDDKERHQQFKKLFDTLNLTDKVFALMETLVPKMFAVMTESSDTLKALDADQLNQAFQQQLGGMKQNLGAVMEPQMIAAMAYQYRDLSATELNAYTEFMKTEAGEHFLDLSLYSGIDYTTEWMLEFMPRVMQKLDTVAK